MSRSTAAAVDTGPRYAIYFAPPPDEPLWAFGSAVLGRDAHTGAYIEPPAPLMARFPDWRMNVAGAAGYGFHATLKAPFHLADGVGETWLVEDVATLAAAVAAVEIGELRVAAMNRFIALVPTAPPPDLHELAATVVRVLDPLRAPVSVADRQRRRPETLSPRQQRHLTKWGYPFVMEDFRFHMTLSGPLGGTQQADAAALLQDLYAAAAAPVVVRDLCIFRQAHRDAPFMILSRHELIG